MEMNNTVVDETGDTTEKVQDSGKSTYIRQASEFLGHAAEYVQQFDPKKADAGVRKYVSRNPGRSLLIAGAVGLIIGVFLRRR